ncbi:MAG: hypothetical protein V7L00_19895 [Nostoc sp.]|uniref:hypothetical protein n=1 Tax=Nostoc sp. TaxID=1180 RepID=UPI002FF82B4E
MTQSFVSLSESNQFLQTQYDAGKLAKQVSLSTERQDPLMGTDFTISYDIQFASPKLVLSVVVQNFQVMSK